MENFGFGVPTFGFYEGINDDWNLDRVAPRLPYRTLDYLLLPGIYQQGFYSDRDCRVVGLPNVRNRLELPYFAPILKRRAVINVNFTYGVLEDRRDIFVNSAVQACEDFGLDYIISQHPADKADLSRFKVGKQSVYDLLDEGSLLISRFSTTILEALAIGRPAIYHNPIGEKVPKFVYPLGAYSTSHDVDSLKIALKRELDFVAGGGDVRARAALFLHFHSHSGSEQKSEELAADAIASVLADPPPRFAFKLGARTFEPASPHPEARAAIARRAGNSLHRHNGLVSESWANPVLVNSAGMETNPELEQLRENFKALSSFARSLEQRLEGSQGALPPGESILERLAATAADDADSARLLLSSVGSGLLLQQAEIKGRLADDPALRASITRALDILADDDGHRQQFLQVQKKYYGGVD